MQNYHYSFRFFFFLTCKLKKILISFASKEFYFHFFPEANFLYRLITFKTLGEIMFGEESPAPAIPSTTFAVRYSSLAVSVFAAVVP